MLFGLLLFPGAGEAQNDIMAVAAQEAQKRQEQVKAAQMLFSAGASAMSDRSYGEAMDNFKGAFNAMPIVPAIEEQRRIFFRQYQKASLAFSDQLIQEAKWAEVALTLEDVLATAKDGFIPDSLIDPQVKRTLGDLESPDGLYNRALTPQHLGRVEEVQTKLILAKGYLELGDYDRADFTYNQVLNIDPYNEAARRGQEEIERHRMEYYDAAYDQTRSKALSEVAAGWETPVETMDLGDTIGLGSGDEIAQSGNVLIEQKLKRIIIPSLEFRDARLVDVIDFLIAKSQELDSQEPDPAKKGISIVVDPSGSLNGQDPSQLPVTVRLSNIPMESALKYVTQLVGMKYRVDEYAVFVVPNSVAFDAGMITRRYPVPPGFISAGNQGAGAADAVNDPFAAPASGTTGLTLKRIKAQEFLEQSGVVFPPGASASYIATTSTLVVTNNIDQHATVENLIQISKDSGSKMVKVNVKMVSIEDENLNALGLDWLLGEANFASSQRVFFAGGTDGSTRTPTEAIDYPFVSPVDGFPVGMNPVTGGLRMADVSSTQSIDDIINRGNPSAGSSKYPGVFSVAGVFTDPQFQMVVRSLAQSKGSDTMCDSHVFVKPGQIASIEQVREFIYPTEYDPPEIPNQIGGGIDGGGDVEVFPVTPATPTAFETRKLGKVIEVEPTVSSDNLTVNLNVTADFSDFTGFINYGTPILGGGTLAGGQRPVVTENEILMPVFDSVRETTNVTVWDGQTIAIGGFHGESVAGTNDKVPVVGDLPVLGKAFRSNSSERSKRALLIFVSVRLVDPGGNPINASLVEEPELMTRRDDGSNLSP